MRKAVSAILVAALCLLLAGCTSQSAQNLPPTVNLSLSTQFGKAPTQVAFNWTCIDPEQKMAYCAVAVDGKIFVEWTPEKGWPPVPAAPVFDTPGEHYVAIFARDSQGLNATQNKIVVITENSDAGSTNALGEVNFVIAGTDAAFAFTDEETGKALAGLSVAYAFDENTSQGVLLAIDPSDKYPPQVVLMGNTPSMQTAELASGEAGAAEGAIAFASGQKVSIPVSKLSYRVMRRALLSWVPSGMDAAITNRDLTMLALRTLDMAGLPVGGYMKGRCQGGATNTYTPEQALANLKQEAKDKVKSNLFFFMQPENLATLKGPDPQSIITDTLNLAIDASSYFACRDANQRVVVTEACGMKFYDCKYTTELRDWDWGFVKFDPNGPDAPSSGSLELFSKANIGLGYAGSGKDGVKAPVGGYVVNLKAPGYATQTTTAQVTNDSTSLVRWTAQPIQGVAPTPTEAPTAAPTATPSSTEKFSASIDSINCRFKPDDSRRFVAYLSGNASGPVGTTLEPLAPTDGFSGAINCGVWTPVSAYGIPVAYCRREAGQPESMAWTYAPDETGYWSLGTPHGAVQIYCSGACIYETQVIEKAC